MTPEPFDVLPGDHASPVVLHVPHAGTAVPADVRAGILLDDAGLGAELRAMTDAATDRIAAAAAASAGAAASAAVRPWTFVNRLSRLVVDPERFTDPAREEMEAVGMGAVYTATSHLRPLRRADAAARERLLARYFAPYAEALAALVDSRLAACGRAVVLDIHSYPREALPYERHPDARRPEVCLGADPLHTPAGLLEQATAAFAEWELAVDEPFAGTYVPLRHYGTDLRVSSLMVEIRRDQYLDAAGEPVAAEVERLGSALAALVGSLGAGAA